MALQIILHIGINKTGSSAIQRFFHDRRDALLKHGVLYPKVGYRGENHHILSRLLGFGPWLDIDDLTRSLKLKDLKQSLIAELSSDDCRFGVVSSENFMLPRMIKPVEQFFKGMDVRVVVYLRRHDHWRESAYSQGLRMVSNPPWEPGFEGWLQYQERKNSKYGNYRLLVDTWAQAFGKSNLIVRPYEKQQNQPDIVTDFLRAASLEEAVDGIDKSVPRVNESLSLRAMSLLELFQRIDVDPKQRTKLVRYACSLAPDDRKYSVVSPKTRRRLVVDNLADYAYIARQYLGREDGRLFHDPLPDPNEDWQPPQALTAEEIDSEITKALGSGSKVKNTT